MAAGVQTKPITADEVAEREAQGSLDEIVNGQWVEVAVTGEIHGAIEARLVFFLMGFVLQHKLGRVYPGDTTFVLEGEPGNIIKMRRPDVAFVQQARAKQDDREEYNYLAPDLAVEIISKSEQVGEVQEKLEDYLRYGVQEVWQVYPRAKQVIVHRQSQPPVIYSSGQTISGSLVLPGFELAVDEIFDVE